MPGEVLNEDINNFLRGKKILITGSSGFLATNLISALIKLDCELVLMSRGSKGHLKSELGNPKVSVIKSNYRKLADFEVGLVDVDIVYHLASQTSIYKAEEDPVADFGQNVMPMMLLLEACRINNHQPIIIFSGTSTQCGMPQKLPVSEKIPDLPITTYDFHKLQAEQTLKFYSQQEYVKGVSFRLTNVYGPGPKSSNSDRGILNMMIKKALKGEDLTIYGSGEFIRDYIFIDDVIRVFLSAPLHIGKLRGKHLLLGSGEGTTVFEAIKLVSELVSEKTGSYTSLKNINPPTSLLPIEYRNFIADMTLLENLGIIKDRISLHEGLLRTIESFAKIE